MIRSLIFLSLAFSITVTIVQGFAFSCGGVKVISVRSGDQIDLEDYLKPSSEGRTLFIFGTYAADFNTIEYAQRLRYYLPRLKEECGITKFGFLINSRPEAVLAVMEHVDLTSPEVRSLCRQYRPSRQALGS